MNFSNIFKWVNTFYSKKQASILMFGVFVVALFWRLYRINTIPHSVTSSEANLLELIKSLPNQHWLIGADSISQAIYIYTMAGIGYLAHYDLLTLRITQAILGTISVVLVYNFVKNWFNRQTALLAGLFIATNSFHLIISRTLEPKVLVIPVIISFLYLVTISLRTNKVIHFILAGFVAGISFYVDSSFIFLPILFVAAVIYFYFKNKKILSSYARGIGFALASLLIVLLPYLWFFPKTIINFGKLLTFSIGLFYLNLGSLIQTMFFQQQIPTIYNIGTEPIFDPFITASFLAGLVYAIFCIKRKKFMVLAAWFTLFCFILSTRISPDYLDLVYLLVPVFTLSSIMLDYILTNWVRTFPFNKLARLVLTFTFSLFIFLSIYYNYEKYFRVYNIQMKQSSVELQNK